MVPTESGEGEVRLADRVVIFVHSGDYDRLHAALSVAATAAAGGRAVDVVFSWYGLEAIVGGAHREPRLPDRPDLEERLREGTFPTVTDLITAARETGRCTFYGCTGSAAILGLRSDRLTAAVDHPVGWSTILQVTRGVVDRFFF